MKQQVKLTTIINILNNNQVKFEKIVNQIKNKMILIIANNLDLNKEYKYDINTQNNNIFILSQEEIRKVKLNIEQKKMQKLKLSNDSKNNKLNKYIKFLIIKISTLYCTVIIQRRN
jgi:hypothetical protein